ncbi:MAG TPA: response regulator [Tepidisphaeraceae bacterium]|nr:response regulator [Tepidisphaeraceae bacterium]
MLAKILVVEDDETTLEVMARLLRVAGYNVKAVDGYGSAVSASNKEHFDMLVSDIGLQDGDGCRLLSDLQSRWGPHRISGVAVSGFSSPEDIERSRQAGYAAHLVKPVDFHRLVSVIQSTLELNRRAKSSSAE